MKQAYKLTIIFIMALVFSAVTNQSLAKNVESMDIDHVCHVIGFDGENDYGFFLPTLDVQINNISDCYIYDGNQYVTVEFDVSWMNVTTIHDDIILNVTGAIQDSVVVDVENTGVGNALVAVTIPLPVTGIIGNVYWADDPSVNDVIAQRYGGQCIEDECVAGSGIIGGTVWMDYQLNGTYDERVDGIEGVMVFAFEDDGSGNTILAGTATTNQYGHYYFTGLTDGKRYRIDFDENGKCPNWSHSQVGADANTTVQFVDAPSCNVNMGWLPSDCHCEDDPRIAIACFVGQEYDGIFADEPALVWFDASNSGRANTAGWVMPTYIAKHQDVGAICGLAHDAINDIVYSAAYLKRGAGFGPSGPGAIYQTDAQTGVTTTFADINSMYAGNPAGVDNHDFSGDSTSSTFDNAVMPFVGKMAFGDIELSSTGDTLFAVSMADKHLYIFPTGATPTSANTTRIALPTVTDCIADDTRPHGLGVDKNGNLHIGFVCSDQSINSSAVGIEAYVYRWDGGAAFTKVLQFDLTFPRYQQGRYWFPWSDNAAHAPMLTDIEFDNDFMAIGFRNRYGDQEHKPYYHISSHTLRAFWDGGQWTLEQNGTSGPNSGYITSPNETDSKAGGGPGGGTFYDDNSLVFTGREAQGGVTMIPGRSHLFTVVDIFTAWSAGVHTVNPEDGMATNKYDIYRTTGWIGASFAKLNGLGDMEVMCAPAPIEIGNRVWKDADGNGVQDPEEVGLAGIWVYLLTSAGDTVAAVQTDANGNYLFNDAAVAAFTNGPDTVLPYNTSYYIIFGSSAQWNSSTNELNGVCELTLTNVSGQPGPVADGIDNDAILTSGSPDWYLNHPRLKINTGDPGSVNHSYDVGFKPVVLPVEFAYFNVKDVNCKVEIAWGTETELNTDYFVIERSDDGVSYAPIGQVNAAGNSQSSLEYEFTDENPLRLGYYRLKQVDLDGSFEYFPDSRSINVECLNGVQVLVDAIYPNPIQQGSINLDIINPLGDRDVRVEILDELGRMVDVIELSITKGLNQVQYDINALAAGAYMVQIEGIDVPAKRFVKF